MSRIEMIRPKKKPRGSKKGKKTGRTCKVAIAMKHEGTGELIKTKLAGGEGSVECEVLDAIVAEAPLPGSPKNIFTR